MKNVASHYGKLKRLVPMLLLATSSAYAADITGNVTLEKVTLFLRGAELQGKTTVQVPKGESEILLTHVASGINPRSINLNIGNEAMILSTSIKNDYISEVIDSDTVKSLKASLEQLKSERDVLKIKITVVKEEVELLKGNRLDALKNQNSSISDAKMLLNFIKDNLVEALTEEQGLQYQLDELNRRISQYKLQIKDEQGKASPSGSAILVKVYSPKDTTLPVNLSYVTAHAGWAPTYDVRVQDIDSPLVMTYKADVYQNSGLDWSNIDFSLSTANPTENITAPVVSPWYVTINDYSKGFGSLALSKQETMVPAAMYEDARQRNLDSNVRSKDFTDYVVTNNNGINLQYEVKLPYTIKSNSSNNTLMLKATEVAAKYRYIATPKLDSNAFLQAQIVDWDRLSLLPGKSTVFFAGNYIGEGYITTQGVKETLDISLGKDKNILISRNQDVNETSKPSFLGNSVAQKFAYSIDIRNSKTSPIDITIYDQLPLIQNKAIELEDAKYNGAEYNKETGLLTWKVNIKPSEVKQLPFSFKVSYPKDKSDVIIGL